METRLERLVSVGWVVAAGVVIWLSQSIPTGAIKDALGPRAFPVMISLFMAVCSLWVLAEPLLSHFKTDAHGRPVAGEQDDDDDDASEGPLASAWRIPGAIAIIGVYIVLIPTGGFRIATLIASATLLLLMGVRGPRVLVGLPVVTAFGLYWLFKDILDINLP